MSTLLRCVACLGSFLFFVGATSAAEPTSGAPGASDVARRYITAVQQADYKTLIDLSYAYQQEVAQLKEANPKGVWDRVIGQYYDSKTKALANAPTAFWAAYGEFLASSFLGNPTRSIRSQMTNFPKSCKWQITETRRGSLRDDVLSQPYDGVTVFVEVHYATLQSSPRIAQRFLKSTIFSIRVDSSKLLVRSLSRIVAGDTFWTPPYAKEALPFLAQQYMQDLMHGAGNQATLDGIVSLGPESAIPALRTLVTSGGRWAGPAATALADLKDSASLPMLLDQLRRSLEGPTFTSPCDPSVLTIIRTFGRFPPPAPEAVSFLRDLMGTLALHAPPRSFAVSPDCVSTVLEALGTLDRPAWNTFPFWQIGNDVRAECPNGDVSRDRVEFQRVREDLCVHAAASTFIDPDSPSKDRVLAFLNSLSPCRLTMNRTCPAIPVMESVHIDSPTRARILGHVNVPTRQAGAGWLQREAPFEFVLRASGILEKPWLLADVILPWESWKAPTGACAGARDQGFTVRDAGRDYAVLVGSTADGQARVFEDEAGAVVTDPNILRRLTAAAWTYENVVTPPSVRAARDVVRATRETLEGLQQYQQIQDALARAFVEGLAAEASGGASLESAVARVSMGLVKEQLAKPRLLLALTARIGLRRSEDTYSRLLSELPPPDVKAIDTSNTARLKSLFTEASALQLAYGKLASDLMPKTGLDLLDQALTSMASEFLAAIPAGDAQLSPADVFHLEEQIVTLAQEQGLLKGFQESFALAAGLGPTSERTIDKEMAASALASCASPTPTVDDFADYLPLNDGYSWEFTVGPMNAKPGAPKGTYTSRVEGREMVNGATYTKVVSLFGGQDPSKAEVNYGRRGRLGLYELPAVSKDGPEFLSVPFPIPFGEPWTVSGSDQQLTCRAFKEDAISVGDSRYSDVLRIDCSGQVRSVPFGYTTFSARGTGTIRQIVRPQDNTLLFELVQVHRPGQN